MMQTGPSNMTQLQHRTCSFSAWYSLIFSARMSSTGPVAKSTSYIMYHNSAAGHGSALPVHLPGFMGFSAI
jgi:hypothetical protein